MAQKKPKRVVRWDTKIPAFGVRTYAGGKRSYILRYRNRENRERLYTIGNANVLTLEQARSKAKKLLGRIEEGADPLQDRQDARTPRAEALTFQGLADQWMALHAKKKRRSWKEDQRRLEYILAELGDAKAEAITTPDLNRFHAMVGKERGEIEANRAITLIRAIYGKKSRKLGLVPNQWENPASDVEPFDEPERTRIVRQEEFPKLLEAIQSYANPFVSGAILALLFSGLRKRDVLNLRWAEVDMGAGFILLSTEKTGKPRMVPISGAMRRLLEALPRFEGNPHVFCGRKEGEPLKDIRRGWEAIRAKADCPDLRLHDFKRTVGTLLALAGENQFVIQQVLGHADERTARTYVKLAAEMTSGVMDRYGAQVEALANGGATKALPGGSSHEG